MECNGPAAASGRAEPAALAQSWVDLGLAATRRRDEPGCSGRTHLHAQATGHTAQGQHLGRHRFYLYLPPVQQCHRLYRCAAGLGYGVWDILGRLSGPGQVDAIHGCLDGAQLGVRLQQEAIFTAADVE